MRNIIKKILLESIEPNKIEVGDIFSTAERDVENKPLIMVTDIIQDGKPGIKSAQTRWGTKQYESDGYSLNYKVSLDNGDTWKYEDGEGHYVDTGWIGELIKMGHWSLEQKNMDLGGDFFDSLTESEKNEGNYDCVGINLSNLTTDEKIKVLEKLEQVYNTFVGFSRYAWVDQIQYLVTDFTTPVTVSLTLASLKGRIGKCGRYFTSVPENAYKEETDSYETPISMGGTKLKWSKEIDGREFLNIPFIDDTSELFESEEDEFKWVEDIIDNMSIKLGDVFYIVDSDYAGPQHSIGYRPENVRYTLFVSDIFQDDEDKYIDYIECNSRNISYNPKDFNITKCRSKVTTVKYEKALELINQNYWRPMGNNGYYSHLTESEEDEFGWLGDLNSEPFQNVLIKNNPRSLPNLSDDIDVIMFNPPVAVGDSRFNKIAYWLEDEDYYPKTLVDFGVKTSYIEITRHKDDRQNGRWEIGPQLTEQELYDLSQTPKHSWNGNFWEEEVLQVI